MRCGHHRLLLHSWRDGAQEAAVKVEIERLAPGLFCFTSAEVWSVIREYERTSTAILNGYVHPRVSGYLTALEDRLKARGVPAAALLTRSNGGLMNAAEGKRACVNMLLSGTASGVIGAGWLARQAGEARILTLDIGGTSADFALVVDGEAQYGTGELIGEFPLYIPSVSVSSIGIGGGSIASVDAQGVLRVGPESAGSVPGPACYGRGGNRATVTDAMVVCGWLGHTSMAYGQLSLDVARARAVMDDLAAKLGRTREETAQAILDIAVSEMFVRSRSSLRVRAWICAISRSCPSVAAGRCSGHFLHANSACAGDRTATAGVVSALGGLVADLRGDFIRTVFTPLSAAALPALRETCDALSREGLAWLAAQGHRGRRICASRPICAMPAELRDRGDA